MNTVTVLGGGSWGTALTFLLSPNVEQIWLWDRTPAHVRALQAQRENTRYLPGFPLPANVFPTSDIVVSVARTSLIVLAVPTAALSQVVIRILPHLPAGTPLVLASKGMASESGLFAHEIILSQGEDSVSCWHPLIALSGPNLAGEVAQNVPAAAVAAASDPVIAEKAAHYFQTAAFRVYTGSDLLGVEIGGAVKNVLAIAAGVSDGLGYGENTKAALLTRGLAEMTRFGVACGAEAATFYGLAGVGDLMATAASRQSRNWRVGAGIARGESLEQVLTQLGQVAEGVPTAKALQVRAARVGVEMPVCQTVAALLFDGLSPRDAVAQLMARSRKGEWE